MGQYRPVIGDECGTWQVVLHLNTLQFSLSGGGQEWLELGPNVLQNTVEVYQHKGGSFLL